MRDKSMHGTGSSWRRAFYAAFVLSLCAAWEAPARSAGAEETVRVNMVEAVRRALRDNPGLAASAAGSRAAEEGRKAARGAFGPKLGMSYNVSRVRQESAPRSAQIRPERDAYAWDVEISQPLFAGFKLLSAYQRSALRADSEKAVLRQTELALTEQVQSGFFRYLRARENARSAGDALARLRSQLDIARAYYGVGLRPRLDVLQAEVDVSKAESTLIQEENARETARAKLNTLLGLPATARVDYEGDLSVAPFSRDLEECLNTAYSLRPDLYIARKSVEIAVKDRRMTQSGYYPQIDAYYRTSTFGNTPDLRRAGENGGQGVSWEAGARASWDVFSWGTTYYADQEAGFNVAKLRHEEENLRLSAGYDVKSRLLALWEAEKRIAVARKGMEQAQEAYKAALARYQAQVGTNFDVLDASSKLSAAEAALTAARADYLTALSSLYAAMGEQHSDLTAQKNHARNSR